MGLEAAFCLLCLVLPFTTAVKLPSSDASLVEVAAKTSQVPAFNEKMTPVTEGLILYLDGEDYAGGDTWKDRSGVGNDAGTVAGMRPLRKTLVSWRDKRFGVAELFPGAGVVLGRDRNLSVNRPYTIFMVDRYIADNMHRGRVLQARNGRNWLMGKWYMRTVHYAEGWVPDWERSHAFISNSGQFEISVATMDNAGTAEFIVDGNSRGAVGGRTPPGSLSIGMGTYWNEWSDAHIAACLIYNRVLTHEERVQVEWWLSKKYGMVVPTANLCAKNNGGCDILTSCVNVEHTRTCGKCPAGYKGNGDQAGGCKDIDECHENKNGGCDALVTCTNKPGTFECGPCPFGYEGDGKSGCIDINECLIKNGGCDPRTECINFDGGSKCGDCKSGWKGNGKEGCKDVNECETDNGGCDKLTTCNNNDGSFTCGECPAGYSGTGENGCEDIDECTHANGACHRLTKCLNTPGGRTCSACPAGFEGNGEQGCTDVNECAVHNGGCDKRTQCHNTRGSRSCGPCPDGYTGMGQDGCVDIDECKENNGNCDPLTKCKNIPGKMECGPCPSGYKGDGVNGCFEEGASDETTQQMAERVAEEAARDKAMKLQLAHEKYLKEKILEQEAAEKKARLETLKIETAKLEEMTVAEAKRKEEDDRIMKALAQKRAEEAAKAAADAVLEEARQHARQIFMSHSLNPNKVVVDNST